MISKLVLFIAGTVVVSAAFLGESCTQSSQCSLSTSSERERPEDKMCCGTDIFEGSGNIICIPRMLTELTKGDGSVVTCIDGDDEDDMRPTLLCDNDCQPQGGPAQKQMGGEGGSPPELLCSYVTEIYVDGQGRSASFQGSTCRPQDKCNFMSPITKEFEGWTITKDSECDGGDLYEDMQVGQGGAGEQGGQGKRGGCEQDTDCERRNFNEEMCCGTITKDWETMEDKTKCIMKKQNGMTLDIEGKGRISKVCNDGEDKTNCKDNGGCTGFESCMCFDVEMMGAQKSMGSGSVCKVDMGGERIKSRGNRIYNQKQC